MQDLLITHTDLDGISPIILMNLTGRPFEYKSIEIDEVTATIREILELGLNTYENVYITDLTIPLELYPELAKYQNVKIFDHHESHLYGNDYPFATIKVRLNDRLTCGTELFYTYLKELYPILDTPLIRHYVDIVRQCDTWDYTELEFAKQVGSLPFIYGKKEFIKSLSKRLKKDKEKFELTSFEKRYVKLEKQEIDRYLKFKETKMERFEINGYKLGVVFAEDHKSELGNYLSSNNLDLDLIAIISACSRVSYRTVHDDVKCNEFASFFGGGGHQKASGSEIDEATREKIIECCFKDVKRLENGEN